MDFSLFGKVEGVDDHGVDVFHLRVGITELRIIGDEGDVVKQVIVHHEKLAIGIGLNAIQFVAKGMTKKKMKKFHEFFAWWVLF